MKKSTKGAPQAPQRTNTTFRAADWQRPGVSLQEIQEIKQAFDLFDTDLGGSIDTKQLKAAMTSLGFQAKNQTIFQLIADLDTDGSAALQFDEFFALMTANVGDKNTKQSIGKMYKLFDNEQQGFISMENLRRVANQLNENIQNWELEDMLTRADKDRDGGVVEDEFYHIVTKKSFKYD